MKEIGVTVVDLEECTCYKKIYLLVRFHVITHSSVVRFLS